ncbi:MAG: cellulase N-terminal Ig-like domain-containing protein [Marinagarivorans sp.]|nr:cellulase N-terminal Ig-like domain-containing protein [Marinagarivorans sp.]
MTPLKYPIRENKKFIALLTTALFPPSLLMTPLAALAVDDGSQMADKFRVNYAGYLPQASKLGIYLAAENKGPIEWSLAGSDCKGTEDTYISNDKSSGDSFYQIDFSVCTGLGKNLQLVVGEAKSAPFDISSDPYGAVKYDFFSYFKDHENRATFNQSVNDWAKGLSVTFSYVKDAGDNGAYPTNTAEASWALINMLETYPAINTYYSQNKAGARTVYDQLNILTEQFYHVFDHGGDLAIAKFHANVNDTYAFCNPYKTGSCISAPETKATYATARTLAGMARLHRDYGTAQKASDAYDRAVKAFDAVWGKPVVCNQEASFGGEGGYYPDHDKTSLKRNPQETGDHCVADKNNTEDDQFTALVELYLAAEKLQKAEAATHYKKLVMAHPRFNEASSYWWGEVAMEGGLSLLSNESKHSINLDELKKNLLIKADSILAFQAQGYPGVTWDPNSTRWNTGDKDNVDNNVRWGSHRMALNDARIVMAAAEIESARGDAKKTALYTRAAVQVLDHIAGINAVNLAMFTAKDYPFIENAVTRTHDNANLDDTWSGKLVLGPNNWTNANDGAMPEFGSLPGLKMFALTGTGWASREISIDGNASLVPVAYFATEIAPVILAGGTSRSTQEKIIPTENPTDPAQTLNSSAAPKDNKSAGAFSPFYVFALCGLFLAARLRKKSV